MALGKTRGRKPSKKTVAAKSALQKKRHWIDCVACEIEGAYVDGDVEQLTCAGCMSLMVAPPEARKPARSAAEKAERKAARAERKKVRDAAKANREDLGLGRGWHKRILFKTEKDGKALYFSRGKKITAAAYKALEKKAAKTSKAKNAKPSFGRGWHFKKEFVGPDGELYKAGKKVATGGIEPTLKEFDLLMEQNSNG